MSIVFIIGLPASGKTTLALQRYTNHILIDDPRSKPIIDLTKDYVITDPDLCKPKVFDVVKNLYPEAYYIFFTNDPYQCNENLKKRNDGRNITKEYIDKLSYVYLPYVCSDLVQNKEIIEVYNGK